MQILYPIFYLLISSAPATQLSLAHNWGGAERKAFDAIIFQFEKNYPSIDVQIRSLASSEYQPWLVSQIVGEVAPDLFMVSSPGFMRRLAATAKIAAIDSTWNQMEANKWYSDSWKPVVAYQENIYAVPFKTAAKALVWYKPQDLKTLNSKVPESWKSFEDLLQKAKQAYPEKSVFSLGGRDAWPLTDWFEQFLLLEDPAVFQALALGKNLWKSSAVESALHRFLFFISNYFPSNSLEVGFVEAVHARLDGKAFFQLQGGWVNLMTQAYKNTLKPGEDFSFFVIPGKAGKIKPSLVGGDLLVLNKKSIDRREAWKLLEFLASPEAQQIWAKRGGYVAPNEKVSLQIYPDVIAKKEAQLISQAETIFFDLDDQFSPKQQRILWEELQNFLIYKDAKKFQKRLDKLWEQSK